MYRVELRGRDTDNREVAAVLDVVVRTAAVPKAAGNKVPVILLNGWQRSCEDIESEQGESSEDTFGELQRLLSEDGFPVRFFNNCSFGKISIEKLAGELELYLRSLRFEDGEPVHEVDLVAHSMGGLIVRAYLAGLRGDGLPAPPANHKVRKVILISTPNFGALAPSWLGGEQTSEMSRGSEFLWNLATWNQGQDDLRGVDALAIVGNASNNLQTKGADDGVVSLTSGSILFSRPDDRTRIINYCHTTPDWKEIFLDCDGRPSIAKVQDTSHDTFRILMSFLGEGDEWMAIGHTPSDDTRWLSKNGGLYFGVRDDRGRWSSQMSGVSVDNTALDEGATGRYYKEFVPAGPNSVSFSTSIAPPPNCSSYSQLAGRYTIVNCKYGPAIRSVDPRVPEKSSVLVGSGRSITLNGAGFGPRCQDCRVLVELPGVTPVSLEISSWSDQSVAAFLPARFSGLIKMTLEGATGSDSLLIMTRPPAIVLSANKLNFVYTIRGATPAAQFVNISDHNGGSIAVTASSDRPWIHAESSTDGVGVSIRPGELTPGTYNGTVLVTSPDAVNSPQGFEVTLQVTASQGGVVDIIKTIAGNGSSTASGNGFVATSAGVPQPRDVAVDPAGNIYISSSDNIRLVRPDGLIDTLGTIPLPTVGGFPILGQSWTTGIAYFEGSIYAVQNSSTGSRVLRVASDGRSSVFAEPGTLGFNVNQIGQFADIAFDSNGFVYIADSARHRVVGRRRQDTAFSVIAGRTGVSGFSGDGSSATLASLNTPSGLAVDAAGNLYIADSGNHRIRKVDKSGIIATVAGSGGPNGGFAGDGGPAVNARLNRPQGLTIDGLDNVYIADTGNARIRRVDLNGRISTVAGSGETSECFSDTCYSGDGSFAIAARLSQSVSGVTVDTNGDLFVADAGNERVRKITFDAPISSLPTPMISASAGLGVQSGAFGRDISLGSLAVILGNHLAPILNGRLWRDEDLIDRRLPRELEGVSVTIDGKPAYMVSIAPTALQIIVPDDVSTGIVPVVVKTPSGTARTSARVQQIAPALFSSARGPIGTIYAYAVHADGTKVGHPSIVPGSRPARSGDRISIFGTGFGFTNPRRPAGELGDPAPLATRYTVRLNYDSIADSPFGGRVSPGEYRFDIRMPAIRSTDFIFVKVELDGKGTDDRFVLAVSP
ncbi:MAG: hypothetical protein HY820_41505 [Acidobacteria bacterium]|nr:hypothetical protein [Acidobacteriota bacterium]